MSSIQVHSKGNVWGLSYSYDVPFPDIKEIFIHQCGYLPHITQLPSLDEKKVKKFIDDNYTSSFIGQYKRINEVDTLVYYVIKIKEGVFLSMRYSDISIAYCEEEKGFVEHLVDSIKDMRKEKKWDEIGIIYSEHSNLSIKYKRVNDLTFNEDYYNNDLIEIDKKIVKRLSEKNVNGIYLFHGLPGTGKTSYIISLLPRVKKKFLFIPSLFGTSLDSPNFISLLMDNPNSILVLEDAEKILVSRERDKNSSVTALLNITDGMLAQALNIQVICTFNTDMSKIDSALTRKGRLAHSYEFKELAIEKANKILINRDRELISEPTVLANIINSENENGFVESGRSIAGFKTKVAC